MEVVPSDEEGIDYEETQPIEVTAERPSGSDDSNSGTTETANVLVQPMPWYFEVGSRAVNGLRTAGVAVGTLVGGAVIVIMTPSELGDATTKKNLLLRKKKKPKKGVKGKVAAKDVPLWAKVEAPYEDGNGVIEDLNNI